MKVEWDSHKATENLKKHNVAFDDAQLVFLDPFARDELDSEHSTISEIRFIRLGLVFPNILLVVYTVKDESTNTYRIISARRSDRSEEKFYWDERQKDGS